VKNAIALLIAAPGVISLFAMVPLLAYRGIFWLRFGFALEYSGLDFFRDADMGGVIRFVLELKWLGFQKALMWLFTQPFEYSCLAFALVVITISNFLYDQRNA
jgi:hypothetical protein